MRYILFIAIFTACIGTTVWGQSTINITIVDNNTATIEFKNGAAKTTYDKLDFSAGDGKLIVVNNTATNLYSIEISAEGVSIKLPSTVIPTSATAEFKISAAGKVDKATGDAALPKNPTIKVTGAAGVIGTFTSTTEEEDENDIDDQKPTNNTGVDEKKTEVYKIVEKKVNSGKYRYIASQNIIVDNSGVIHIFLDKNLNPIYSYFPTTAKERYDKYKFHIIAPAEYTFSIESESEFVPAPLTDDISEFPRIQADGGKQEYIEYPLPIMGPYSGNFTFVIKRFKNNKDDKYSISRTIKQIKVNRVSLNIATVGSWLRNPENISIFERPGGDSTLVADNPKMRGMLAGFITFHLKPRNLTIPPRTFVERFGVSFGASITEQLGENFFLGLNVEVANGLFFNGGIHFGQVSYPINYDKFDFGNQKFTGTLVTKKRWDTNVYAAVSIDMGLFTKAFKNLLGTGTGTGASDD